MPVMQVLEKIKSLDSAGSKSQTGVMELEETLTGLERIVTGGSSDFPGIGQKTGWEQIGGEGVGSRGWKL